MIKSECIFYKKNMIVSEDIGLAKMCTLFFQSIIETSIKSFIFVSK